MPDPLQSRRLKIGVACEHCRSRKIKCDGVRPVCNNCRRKGGSCTYRPGAVGSRISPIDRPLATDTPSSPPLPHPLPSPYPNSEPPDGSRSRGIPSGTVHGVFAGEVTAAIDARLGLASRGRPSLTPMTDAPLFGSLPRRQVADGSSHHVEDVLPQRKHADHLIDIYWRYIQPVEPFLEQERFYRSYQALFAGGSLETDERIFVSTLNIVFALSTQLQEGMRPEDREEASNTYFHRAWALLRPETIIWESGSLELVQCLLLIARYLQCTNNPHQTWMAVGFAVRIAQSLGLHLPEAFSSSGAPKSESRLRRQIWQCCVYMDRIVSWVLGRTSMIPLVVSSATISPRHDGDPAGQNSEASANYLTKTLELYEICNHIMLSQVSVGNSFADKLGLPRLYQHDEPFSNASRLDACLNQWEKSLPRPLRCDNSLGNQADSVSYTQAVHLHLRLLHGRISLFRPMLARYCLSRAQTATSPTPDLGLSDRILQDCASLCVDNAQNMISMVDKCHRPDGTVGVMAWWYRVFYLHVAGTVLIAATLRADLYTPAVSQSWGRAMAGLRAHEHLSPFVRQCVATFETLSSRISPEAMHHQPAGDGDGYVAPEAVSNSAYFQDVFQDMGFANPDNFHFGMEDMSWLANFELPLTSET